MFKGVDVDWKSGWNCFEDESVSDFVGKLFKTYKTESRLFDNLCTEPRRGSTASTNISSSCSYTA